MAPIALPSVPCWRSVWFGAGAIRCAVEGIADPGEDRYIGIWGEAAGHAWQGWTLPLVRRLSLKGLRCWRCKAKSRHPCRNHRHQCAEARLPSPPHGRSIRFGAGTAMPAGTLAAAGPFSSVHGAGTSACPQPQCRLRQSLQEPPEPPLALRQPQRCEPQPQPPRQPLARPPTPQPGPERVGEPFRDDARASWQRVRERVGERVGEPLLSPIAQPDPQLRPLLGRAGRPPHRWWPF